MLNQDERDSIGRALTNAALFYDRPDIDRAKVSALITILAESFPEANGERILAALASYRADQKNTTFPAPAKLQPYLRPVATDEAQAIESVNRIMLAITKFGYTRGPEARAFVGELGWSVVKDYGGWETFCQNMGVELSEQTFRAQARDSLKSKINLQRAGLLGTPLALPGSEQPAALEAPSQDVARLISSTVREVPK